MQNKIKKYLILICAMGGIVLHGIGLSETHEARALPTTRGTESVQVQVISSENTITLDYSVPEATLTSLDEESPCPKGTCTKTRVRAGNASQKDREGEPVIPVIPSRIIIPAGKAIDNITITRSGEFEHEGEYFLEFGEKARVISNTAPYEPALPDNSIYYSDNPFPGITHELVTVQNKCGVSIAYINLYHITYYPLSGRVISYSSISLNVNLKEAGAQSYDIACRPERVNPEIMGIENPDALDSYTPEYCQQVRNALPTGGICDPSETYEYVIITTVELDNANPDHLDELIEWRSGPFGGQLSVKVANVNDPVNGIYNNYSGSEVPDDPIDKIRSFIGDAFNNWDTKYVLIIGDPNDNDINCIVPMRELWGQVLPSSDWETIYSDLYLQCLNGPYDNDGDGHWGEVNDGQGGNDVDMLSEVFIGRAYVETADELFNFIQKTITYETAVFDNDISFIDNALILGEYLETYIQPGKDPIPIYAKPWLETIRLGANDPKTFGLLSSPYYANTKTLYEPDQEYFKKDVKEEINSDEGYGIINQFGHGNYREFMKLNSNRGGHPGDIKELTNTKLPFLYTVACLVGQPLLSSIGEAMTTSTENAVWGAVLNTNKGIYKYIYQGGVEPILYMLNEFNSAYNREFWNAYIYKGLLHLGEIFVESHEKFVGNNDNNSWRFIYYCNNLFGDPYTKLFDPIPCERYLDIGNFTGYNDVLARKLIRAGGMGAYVNIENGANVTFASGEDIKLLPGFNVKYGAKFSAFIDPILYKSNCD